MLFNSFTFVALVLVTLLLYYIPKFRSLQVQILIVASLTFYTWHNPYLLMLLLLSAGINILTSYKVVYGPPNRKKRNATLGVLANLFTLAFFKYSGLIALTFTENEAVGEFFLSIPLPIGISFFTFQGISLMVDVYKNSEKDRTDLVPKSLLKHAQRTLFFISFFPQLVAGPIVKAHDFLPQIKDKFLRDIDWQRCFRNIVLGYFLKMVIADNLKDYTFWISFPYFIDMDTITLLTVLFGYSIQIFADFAGYSLIAIGISRLFGYNLRDNFNFPYISKSFKEFWKRWHISLSSFLQEYLYYPLGGNRKGKYRTYINLMITMVLGGLWHGAAWSYAIWGAFHGVALAVERLITDAVKVRQIWILRFFKQIMVFSMVTFAWLLFKLPEFSHVIEYFKAMYTNASAYFNVDICTRVLIYTSPVILYHLIYTMRDTALWKRLHKFDFVLYGIMLFLIITNSGMPGEFIYFQF